MIWFALLRSCNGQRFVILFGVAFEQLAPTVWGLGKFLGACPKMAIPLVIGPNNTGFLGKGTSNCGPALDAWKPPQVNQILSPHPKPA